MLLGLAQVLGLNRYLELELREWHGLVTRERTPTPAEATPQEQVHRLLEVQAEMKQL